MVQSFETHPDGSRVGEFLFFDSERNLLNREVRADYQYDPRSRPWFKAADTTLARYATAAEFTDPYIFFTTGQVGLTMSKPSTQGEAIFGIDIVLDDLALNLTELRTSPNAQLALVDGKGRVLVYSDMSRILLKGENSIDFKSINNMGEASLAALNALRIENDTVAIFDVAGEEWIGVSLPFEVWRSNGLRLLVAAPVNDLLGGLKGKAIKLVAVVIALSLCLMPLGWLAGGSIGKSVKRLTDKARRMSRFDFARSDVQPTLVQEVNSLGEVLNDMGQTIRTFLQISDDMAREPQVERMLSNVLGQMVTATRCQAGAVYLWNGHTRQMQRAALIGDLVVHEPLQWTDHAAQATPAEASREVAPGIALMCRSIARAQGPVGGSAGAPAPP